MNHCLILTVTGSAHKHPVDGRGVRAAGLACGTIQTMSPGMVKHPVLFGGDLSGWSWQSALSSESVPTAWIFQSARVSILAYLQCVWLPWGPGYLSYSNSEGKSDSLGVWKTNRQRASWS